MHSRLNNWMCWFWEMKNTCASTGAQAADGPPSSSEQLVAADNRKPLRILFRQGVEERFVSEFDGSEHDLSPKLQPAGRCAERARLRLLTAILGMLSEWLSSGSACVSSCCWEDLLDAGSSMGWLPRSPPSYVCSLKPPAQTTGGWSWTSVKLPKKRSLQLKERLLGWTPVGFALQREAELRDNGLPCSCQSKASDGSRLACTASTCEESHVAALLRWCNNIGQ